MSFWSRDRAVPVQEPLPVPARATASAASNRATVHAPAFQCDAEVLLPFLEDLVSRRRSGASATSDGNVGLAVFFIELRRSDRTQALARLDSARAALDIVCDRFAKILRPGDCFALNGVDEILLVLPEVDSTGRALLVASRLVHVLNQPMRELAAYTRVRPAIGCALYPAHGDDAEELIAAADRAARAARTSDEGYRIAVRSERETEADKLSADLEAALKANELQVFLQPQLNLRTGLFDAAEALIRWPRAEGLPPVSPIVAIELAETHGIMPSLTMFVLNTVLHQSAQFKQRGLDLRIAINVSASMLTDANLPLAVQQSLDLWGVAPERLTLEVTENTMMQDVERSLAILHELKRLGTHLSLDDFGTGYSSFAYLRRMPLDELKIDQLFIRNLSLQADGSANPQREGDLRIVRSIIDIAHNFDLHTVAEGVEDEATLDLLKDLGCDVVQGFFTGRPMPIQQVESWWSKRKG
jgi:EAL domain-containing protein (putative c-di-GMP-specific phosphodiesterase class I)/GGDEF domain-containing protein